jgi:hypothetical protein
MIRAATKPRDLMRASLAILLLLAFQTALFVLFQWEIPEANIQLVTYMLGQLSGFLGGAFLFYFGTTKSSADKNEVIREMGQAIDDDRPTGTARDPVHTDEVGRQRPREMPVPDFGGAADEKGQP